MKVLDDSLTSVFTLVSGKFAKKVGNMLSHFGLTRCIVFLSKEV